MKWAFSSDDEITYFCDVADEPSGCIKTGNFSSNWISIDWTVKLAVFTPNELHSSEVVSLRHGLAPDMRQKAFLWRIRQMANSKRTHGQSVFCSMASAVVMGMFCLYTIPCLDKRHRRVLHRCGQKTNISKHHRWGSLAMRMRMIMFWILAPCRKNLRLMTTFRNTSSGRQNSEEKQYR